MSKEMVPLFFSTAGLRIIVFGGGRVALRKCNYFKGAEITVVSEKVLPEIEKLAHKVCIQKIPENVNNMIDSFEIVIAATDDKTLNDRIRDDAIFMGMYVNSAHGGGNILIPSVLKREKYTVAVSSEGRVPAFPPYLVKELDMVLDERYDRMLDLMIDLRVISKEKISEQHKRREFLESVLGDENIKELVAGDKMKEAKEAALILGGIL